MSSIWAQAAFNLNVAPYDGSFDLRFSRSEQVGPKEEEKEVNVTVSSDMGIQYQLIQELLVPPTNSEGTILPREAFSVYTLRGSNNRGTMSLDSERPVTVGRTLVYTSDQAGTSDSFVIVYILRHALIPESGLYRGRLNYFLEPVDASQQPDRVSLDVEIDVQLPQSVKITTSTGTKTIRLESTKERTQPQEVAISVKGHRGGQYRILQVVEPMISPEGEELRGGAYFFVSAGKNGVVAQTGKNELKPGETLLYTSNPRGLDDEIIVTYVPEEDLPAGRFRGSISYYLQEYGLTSRGGLIDVIQLEVESEAFFEIKITPQTGGLIEFGKLKSGQMQTSEVLIEITSNLAKPYQVTQNVITQLTDKEGRTIPKENFTFCTQDADEQTRVKGTLKYPTKVPVEVGETVIFVSDNSGASNRFKVVYELEIPRDQRGGNYTAGMNYALAQIGMP